MSVPGTFIVSLDCEGKWGMADHLQPYHHAQLTDAALAAVYDRIVALLARYDIAATFAYVMAFVLDEEERREFAGILEDRGSGDAWLKHFWTDLREGRQQGWFQPHALEAVRADGRHEIACHGFCHRPLGDRSISAAGAEAELEAAARAARLKRVDLSTFIYPRNEVGHVEALRKAGFIGYREKLARPGGAAGRMIRLAEELNVRPALQRTKPAGADRVVRIPAGYFFNWRFGSRSRIPAGFTVRRWKSLLDRSAAHGTVAHLWLHPHNLITAPDTGDVLEAVLAHAAALAAAGKLRIETQHAYSRRLLAVARPAQQDVVGAKAVALERL